MLKAAKSRSRSAGTESSPFCARPVTAAVGQVINRLADSLCPILIVGEPGSGKRSLAKRIHEASSQSRNSFLEINGKTAGGEALNKSLRTPGTLYFPEIADLSLAAQTSLMDGYFSTSGCEGVCRILAGTSRNLQEEVRSRRMREDLFYAIGSVSIQTFPLRCRKNEIVETVEKLLDDYAIIFGRPKPVLSPDILTFMLDYDWPGNFRELETAAKTLVAIGDESIAIAAFRASATKSKTNGDGGQLSLKQASRAASLQAERVLISEVLATTGWNRKKAARELHISYKALLYKIRQIGMENNSAVRRNGQMQ